MLVETRIPRELLVDNYVAQILHAWQSTVEGFLDCGKLLLHAKKKLPRGQFLKMLEHDYMPFGPRMAQIMMRVGSNKNITNTKHVSHLPPHIGTLNQLARLDETTFRKALAKGDINPFMDRKAATSLVLKVHKRQRLARAAEQNIEGKTSLWLADPPWRTSFDLPYETMSCEAIKGLRMRPDGKASTDPKYPSVVEASAKCAAIGLWAIDELLHEAEDVLEAWDFGLLGRIIWDKGSHVRAGGACLMQHEYLLIGVRGGAAPVWKPKSVMTVPRAGLRHSEKPAEFHSMLARMFPVLVERTELFARRATPGWRGWGNQYPGDVAKSRAA